MRKPNKKVQEIKQRNAEKRARRKKARKGIRRERLSRRSNIIEAKKEELFQQWVAAVNDRFKSKK